MALEIADINEDQEIKAPSDVAAAVRAAERSSASLGLGGALGGGSSGGGSSGWVSGRRFLRRRLVGGGSSVSGKRGQSGAGTDLGSGGGQSGIDSKRSQRYLDCLGEAKKPADSEKCAAILEEDRGVPSGTASRPSPPSSDC